VTGKRVPGPRLPLEPLMRVVDRLAGRQLSPGAAAERLGVARSNIYAWRLNGVTLDMADKLAIRAGSHPAIVWPEWVDVCVEWDGWLSDEDEAMFGGGVAA
jgi:plasmid maintenance system antidote protein VapI